MVRVELPPGQVHVGLVDQPALVGLQPEPLRKGVVGIGKAGGPVRLAAIGEGDAVLVEELAGGGVEADDRLVRIDQISVGGPVATAAEAVQEPERPVGLERLGAEDLAEQALGPALGPELLTGVGDAPPGSGPRLRTGRIRRLWRRTGTYANAARTTQTSARAAAAAPIIRPPPVG